MKRDGGAPALDREAVKFGRIVAITGEVGTSDHMTVFRLIRWTAVLCAAVLLSGEPAALAHPPVKLACGATITTDTTLRADLTNCPGDGLVIAADGVDLDLGRHTIDGNGAPGSAGVRVTGRRGVTVSGGTVKEFETGIGLSGSDGNRLRGLTLRANTGRGIDLAGGSDGNRIDGNDAGGNAKTGIALTASERNTLTGNTASGNAVTGFLLFGAGRNTLAANRADGNVGNGIAVVEGSEANTLAGNVLSGSQAGIVVDSSARNLVTLNRLTRNGDSIVVLGDGNTVTGNSVSGSIACEDCGGDGIGVFAGTGNSVKANTVRGVATDGIAVASAAGTLVSLNLVDGAGHDGFKVDSPGTTLTRNVALRSGAFAIEAVAGVIDGGGNQSDGSACVNVSCAKAATTPRGRDSRVRRPRPPARTHRR